TGTVHKHNTAAAVARWRAGWRSAVRALIVRTDVIILDRIGIGQTGKNNACAGIAGDLVGACGLRAANNVVIGVAVYGHAVSSVRHSYRTRCVCADLIRGRYVILRPRVDRVVAIYGDSVSSVAGDHIEGDGSGLRTAYSADDNTADIVRDSGTTGRIRANSVRS